MVEMGQPGKELGVSPRWRKGKYKVLELANVFAFTEKKKAPVWLVGGDWGWQVIVRNVDEFEGGASSFKAFLEFRLLC